MKLKATASLILLLGIFLFSSPGFITQKAVIPTDFPVPIEEKPVDQPVTPAAPVVEAKQITFSFVGDCLIATAGGTTHRVGSLNWTADNRPPEYFFKNVTHLFEADDFTVADCENVFTDSAFTPVSKTEPAFWFRSSTKNAGIFKSGFVDIVSMANNHTGDYGAAGFADTEQALLDANLLVGYGNKPVIVEKYGVRIGIIMEGLWGSVHTQRIINQMKAIEAKTDIQIVYFHGGTEKIHKPEEWKKTAARDLVDAGADLVVGGHPHVLQPMEIYNGVPIVYSLGNFVYGGNTQPENRTIIFQATFDGASATLLRSVLIPCYVYTGNTNNWQPAIITDEVVRAEVLDFMNGSRELPY